MSFGSYLKAFSHKGYRVFYPCQLFSLVGNWSSIVAQTWLIYSLTQSTFMLGIAAFVQYASLLLFAPLGGILADKYSRKNILTITQFLGAIIAFLMAFFAFLNLLNASLLISLMLLSGISLALDHPNRQSFMIELVGKKHLPNAISLNAMMFNLSRVVGPLVAGSLLTYFGAALSFMFNAFSFLPIFLFFLLVRLKKSDKKIDKKTGQKFFAFPKIVLKNKTIFANLSIVAITGLFLLPIQALLPVYAQRLLSGSPLDYSLLVGFFGVGCFLGAFYLVTEVDFLIAKRQRKIFIFQLLFCFSILIFIFANNWILALVVLTFGGFCMVSFMVSINSILQLESDNLSRGRVISLYITLGNGFMPIGAVLMGFLAESWDISSVVLVACVLNMLLLGAIFLRFYFAKST